MTVDARIPTAAEPLIQASLLGEAVDPGPVAIVVADDQMRYVAVNAYAPELLGYTRAELLELRVTDVARTPEAAEQFDEMINARERGGIAPLTKERKRVPARLPPTRDEHRGDAAVRFRRLADLVLTRD